MEPKPDPRQVAHLEVPVVHDLVDAPKDAAADDGEGDGAADEGKDAREDDLVAEGRADLPEDRDGEADYFFVFLLSVKHTLLSS